MINLILNAFVYLKLMAENISNNNYVIYFVYT